MTGGQPEGIEPRPRRVTADLDPVGGDAPAIDHRLVSAGLGLIGGCVLFVANHMLKLPVPLYLPELATWTLQAPPDVIAMRYFGSLIYLVAGFLLGWAAGRVPPLASRLGQGRAARLLARGSTVVLLLAMLYFAFSELSHWSG